MAVDLLVSLSDVHLGAFNTTWAFVTDTDSPALSRLGGNAPDWKIVDGTPGHNLCNAVEQSIREEIARLGYDENQIDKRILILNGDILDLSLAPTAFACLNARCFFHWVERAGFKEVVYIPGNHDHHLWRIAVEEAALHAAVAQGRSRYDRTVAVAGVSSALKSLLGVGDAIQFRVAYPHYVHVLSRDATGAAEEWRLVFHHGHLLEKWWTALSTLLSSPDGRRHTLEQLEAINEPLTELLWFSVGDAGRLSDLVSQFYAGADNSDIMRHLVSNVVSDAFVALERRWNVKVSGWKRWLIRGAIVKATTTLAHNGLAGGTGKHKRIEATAGGLRGVALGGELYKAAVAYRSRYASVSPSCFIFGHTNKTQVDEPREWLNLAAQGNPTGFEKHIFNTGGWVVEPTVRSPDASYLIAIGPKVKLVKVPLSDAVIAAALANADLA